MKINIPKKPQIVLFFVVASLLLSTLWVDLRYVDVGKFASPKEFLIAPDKVNLFRVKQIGVDYIPQRAMEIDMLGVVNTPAGSLVILSLPEKASQAQIFSLNEEISSGIFLREIRDKNIVIEFNGKLQNIEIAEPRKSFPKN